MSLSNNKNALFGKKGGDTNKPKTEAPVVTKPIESVSETAKPSRTAGILLNTSTSTISAEAKQKKLNEAHEYYLKGEENLKTSFFQWNPDHLAAASNFENASELFKAALQPKRALKSLIMCADEYEKANILSSAALNRSKSAELAKEVGDLDQCVSLLISSANTWGIYGDLQRYGETLEKAAKEVCAS
jgi:hypothetical protein